MISHGLIIVINELKKHLEDVYNVPFSDNAVLAGNLAEGFGPGGVNSVYRDKIIFTLVNIKEESTFKNQPSFARNNAGLAAFENPPLFLNYLILIASTHTDYHNALIMLTRTIRFFQSKSLFSQETITPLSLLINAPSNALDRLESLKFIFEMYSPTIEETNHVWGTLGGKHYPFALYRLRIYNY